MTRPVTRQYRDPFAALIRANEQQQGRWQEDAKLEQAQAQYEGRMGLQREQMANTQAYRNRALANQLTPAQKEKQWMARQGFLQKGREKLAGINNKGKYAGSAYKIDPNTAANMDIDEQNNLKRMAANMRADGASKADIDAAAQSAIVPTPLWKQMWQQDMMTNLPDN